MNTLIVIIGIIIGLLIAWFLLVRVVEKLTGWTKERRKDGK